jgi:osmotically-inducible protein OsmY
MKLSYSLAGPVLATAAMQALAQTSVMPADNSQTNKDESHQVVSADAQKNDTGDLSLTRRIRQQVIADKTLSTYAHNVKIVAVGGTVTLLGPVRSEAEKSAVQAKAVSVAGPDHVVNQLTVVAPKS